MTQSAIFLRKSLAADDRADDLPPYLIKFFMVQGVGFHCVAYHDEDGRWFDAHTREELFGPIKILE